MKKYIKIMGIALLLAGCASAGEVGDVNNQRSAWFSYLNGDDLRVACTPGVPSRLRAVYNAAYPDHARAYEIHYDGLSALKGQTATNTLSVRVFELQTEPPSGSIVTPGSLFDPWRGRVYARTLDATTWRALKRALAVDGINASGGKDLTLDSRYPYWIVSGCVDGKVVFGAFDMTPVPVPVPSPRFEKILVSSFRDPGALPAFSDASPAPVHNPSRDDLRDRYRFLIRTTPTGLDEGQVFTPSVR